MHQLMLEASLDQSEARARKKLHLECCFVIQLKDIDTKVL